MHTRTPTAACIYCRLSHAPDGRLEKVERQEELCRRLGARLDWPICCVFVDNNRSAWKRNRKRKGWDDMLTTLQPRADHQHDGIITYHGDRLMRQPWDLESLLRITDDRAILLASVSGTRDLSSADDRFVLRIEVAQACRESDNASRRIKAKLAQRAERGLPHFGGRRAFGFERGGLTHRPAEAALISEAAEMLLAGATSYSVARFLTRESGQGFDTSRMVDMMRSPRLAGLLQVRGEVVGKAAWDPIIDVETWQNVCAVLDERKRQNPKPVATTKYKYLLSGHALCGSCRHPMSVSVGSAAVRGEKKRYAYQCVRPLCPRKVSRDVRHLDAYVVGRTLQLLSDEAWLETVLQSDEDQRQVGAEIAALERRRADAKRVLKSLADHPDVSADDVLESLASFRRRIEELRAKRAQTTRQQLVTRMQGMTLEQWDDTPLDIRRTTVRALWHITVLPRVARGPGFETDRVIMRARTDDAG